MPMANIIGLTSIIPAFAKFSKTVVMPKAQRPSGAGLAMLSFTVTGAGVVGIKVLEVGKDDIPLRL